MDLHRAHPAWRVKKWGHPETSPHPPLLHSLPPTRQLSPGGFHGDLSRNQGGDTPSAPGGWRHLTPKTEERKRLSPQEPRCKPRRSSPEAQGREAPRPGGPGAGPPVTGRQRVSPEHEARTEGRKGRAWPTVPFLAGAMSVHAEIPLPNRNAETCHRPLRPRSSSGGPGRCGPAASAHCCHRSPTARPLGPCAGLGPDRHMLGHLPAALPTGERGGRAPGAGPRGRTHPAGAAGAPAGSRGPPRWSAPRTAAAASPGSAGASAAAGRAEPGSRRAGCSCPTGEGAPRTSPAGPPADGVERAPGDVRRGTGRGPEASTQLGPERGLGGPGP